MLTPDVMAKLLLGQTCTLSYHADSLSHNEVLINPSVASIWGIAPGARFRLPAMESETKSSQFLANGSLRQAREPPQEPPRGGQGNNSSYAEARRLQTLMGDSGA